MLRSSVGTETELLSTQAGRQWKRHVLEDAMVNGRALAVRDLNGDTRDEIIAGFRGQDYLLYMFTADDQNGEHWTGHTLTARSPILVVVRTPRLGVSARRPDNIGWPAWFAEDPNF
ncbi:MAG TPA: hypothetical protein VKE70_28875 [Candidatus Solibacter sp.]|nr:hypothetical protein [Candidatus Solibacter sp.]